MTDQAALNILEGVDFDEEGYMKDPDAWNREIAEALAAGEEIALTEAHWKVIEFCRQRGAESGSAPTLRQITKGSGVSTKELFALFPKGPAKKVAKISGLGKPEGCV
jgi:tRNA 2-thiouridine synthesizing protein E